MGFRKKGKKRANSDDTNAEGAAANKRDGGAKAARRDNASKHPGYETRLFTNAAYEEYYRPLVPEVRTRTPSTHPALAIPHMRVFLCVRRAMLGWASC
jgi:hypothetical protein